jgi:arylsulfatase A-like enzyme
LIFPILCLKKVPKAYEQLYKNVPNENRRKILGMISLLDDSIKEILNALQIKGILDDTLIFFTSDVNIIHSFI